MLRLFCALSRQATVAALARRASITRAALLLVVTSILFLILFRTIPVDAKVLLFSKSSTFSCKPDQRVEAYDASCALRHDEAIIPNVAHFVYILSDTENGTFPFKFTHFLSAYSAWRYWKPDAMYLHTNVGENSNAVQGARSGAAGKWAERLLNLPGLIINTVEAPLYTDHGKKIERMEHRSDFVRVKAVHDFGGIYIDLDVHALRDLKQLREAGYDAVAGKQGGGLLNSGTFLARKGSKAMKTWITSMQRVYDGRWTTHSNEALTTVANDLNSSPCEMLVLDQTAFAPIGWKWFDGERLFGEHYAATSLERLDDDAVPSTNNFDDDDRDEKYPSLFTTKLPWALDWSCTYLLHAFSRQMPKLSTPNNEITPRYIAQRRSLFTRAVYPMLRDMYRNGAIDRRDLE